jgi:DNA-binding NarL/FixJ family response regulator
MLEAIGLEAFAERARRELVATGETVRRPTDDSPDALTPQEASITRLAGVGRTHAEIGAQLFLSARSVECHLRKVSAKLGVSSRHKLRRASSVTVQCPRSIPPPASKHSVKNDRSSPVPR